MMPFAVGVLSKSVLALQHSRFGPQTGIQAQSSLQTNYRDSQISQEANLLTWDRKKNCPLPKDSVVIFSSCLVKYINVEDI